MVLVLNEEAAHKQRLYPSVSPFDRGAAHQRPIFCHISGKQ
jgi:hypothetical protein